MKSNLTNFESDVTSKNSLIEENQQKIASMSQVNAELKTRLESKETDLNNKSSEIHGNIQSKHINKTLNHSTKNKTKKNTCK